MRHERVLISLQRQRGTHREAAAARQRVLRLQQQQAARKRQVPASAVTCENELHGRNVVQHLPCSLHCQRDGKAREKAWYGCDSGKAVTKAAGEGALRGKAVVAGHDRAIRGHDKTTQKRFISENEHSQSWCEGAQHSERFIMRRVIDALALIPGSKAASVKKHDDSGSASSGGNVSN
jgi:hypothetical protein